MVDARKGKGKAVARENEGNRSEEPRTSSSGGASSAALSIASALRSSMASSQLGSLMQSASGGKADFAQAGQGNSDLRDWLVKDLRSSASASSAQGEGQRERATFRTTSSAGPEAADHERMFKDFERGMTLEHAAPQGGQSEDAFPRTWTTDDAVRTQGWRGTGMDPTTAGVIQSYTQLDGPLHAAVRGASTQSSASAGSNSGGVAERFGPVTAAAPLAHTDDVFALLDAEEQTTSTPASHAPIASDPTSALSSDVLSRFDANYRAPSPSNSGFSAEQAAMHLSLAEAQASEQGRQELAVPRPDNPSVREGVYASTAEAAVASILDGRSESSEVTETQTHDSDRGLAVVSKITRYFGASTYLDDVYGRSHLLRETIEQATQAKVDDSTTEENRQKAIRRLESLWNHLSNTPPQPEPTRGTDWVDSWLRTNT